MKSPTVGVIVLGLALMPGFFSRVPHPESNAVASITANQNTPAQAKDAEPFPEVPRITAEEVQRLAKDKGKVVFVDTDDSEAYEAEHIEGAVNIPFDPTSDLHEKDQSLSALPGDRLVVFYCNCAHEEDSAPMVMEMWQLGYARDKVKALKGGLARWEKLGYPLAGTGVSPSKSTKSGI